MRQKKADTYAKELRDKIEKKFGKYDDALDEPVRKVWIGHGTIRCDLFQSLEQLANQPAHARKSRHNHD